MAGITDCSTRIICASLGADLTFAEMVSAKGLSYNSAKTKDLISLDKREEIVGVQLFGHEPSTMSDQAKWVEQELGNRLAYIDINMGCPARKITSKGDGAALIKDTRLACEIVESIKNSVKCRVTAKTRRGYNIGDETCVHFSKSLENAGVDAICIHGRFATQMYRGKSDVSAIARVKSATSIPIIGNGDVDSVDSYVRLKETTCCDAVMIARAAMSKPYLFEQIKDYCKSGSYSQYSCRERMQLAIKHANLAQELTDLNKDLRHFRRHAMCYVEGLKGARVARRQICDCYSAQDFISIFENVIEINE